MAFASSAAAAAAAAAAIGASGGGGGVARTPSEPLYEPYAGMQVPTCYSAFSHIKKGSWG